MCSQVRADAIVDDERQQVAHNTVAQICLSRSVRQSLCSGTCMCVCVSLSLSLSLSPTHTRLSVISAFSMHALARAHTLTPTPTLTQMYRCKLNQQHSSW